MGFLFWPCANKLFPHYQILPDTTSIFLCSLLGCPVNFFQKVVSQATLCRSESFLWAMTTNANLQSQVYFMTFPFPASVDSAISCHCRLYDCLWPMVHRQASSQGEVQSLHEIGCRCHWTIGYIWNLVLLCAAHSDCNFNWFPACRICRAAIAMLKIPQGTVCISLDLVGNKSLHVSPICIAFIACSLHFS